MIKRNIQFNYKHNINSIILTKIT